MSCMLRHLRRPVVDTAGMMSSLIQKELCIKPFGRMMATQASLPKLPVPPMEQTLQKYLRTIRPLVTDDDFAHTQKLVEKFMKSPGPLLQSLLEKRAEEKTNWLSDWWKEVAYLNIRTPVVINSNPAVIFPKQTYTDKDGQLKFAAKLMAGLLNYKTMIDEQTLPVELLGGKPLCMLQYYTVMGGCRIPGAKQDSHVLHPSTQLNPPRHIAVLHKNQLFSLDVYGSDDHPLTADQLYKQLQLVVEMSADGAPELGVLTMMDRTSWARTYSQLVKDQDNKAAMDVLQSSIVVLCLDGPGKRSSDGGQAMNHAVGQMLHGGGSSLNSGNRWYDKTLQIIVGENGYCGLNYEHTTAEGPPISALLDHMLSFCSSKNAETHPKRSGTHKPTKMKLNLSNEVLDAIEEAKSNADSMATAVDLTVLTYDRYGKDFPKTQRLSPDGYIQIALQLTYFKMHGAPCATYETASLRRFQLGRTDTIRSCSVDSFNFTKAMMDPASSRETKIDLLKKAVTAHRKYTDDAINGRGIDRHLLGWKLSAVQEGMNLPDLHMDGSYATSLHFKLSTSQVAAKHNAIMAFGPVVSDGYGVCYNPQNTQLNFSVSAFASCAETDATKYAAALSESLDEIQVLLGAPSAKL